MQQLLTLNFKGTKGHQSGWLVIAVGYGMGVAIPALMLRKCICNHINPASLSDLLLVDFPFSWEQVPYYGPSTSFGSNLGQAFAVAITVLLLEDRKSKQYLGYQRFQASTTVQESRFVATVNGSLNEFVGSEAAHETNQDRCA